ncbi:putative helicase [Abeliophyllum distichum]|uniref:Helicase n=1 Tax=Abeliophyllum distichum TaxID=126358 RepID=A0ABD1VXX6_9LAMI
MPPHATLRLLLSLILYFHFFSSSSSSSSLFKSIPKKRCNVASQSQQKSDIPDNYMSFNPVCSPSLLCQSFDLTNYVLFVASSGHLERKRPTQHLGNSGGTYFDLQENMPLRKLPFDDKLLPRYPFPSANLPYPIPNLFPSMSLRSRVSYLNGELLAMPLLPNIKYPPYAPKYNQQEREINSAFGSGKMLLHLRHFLKDKTLTPLISFLVG